MEPKLKQNQIEYIQTSFSVTKAKELPAGEFEAVLSTEDLDRHGEHVSIKGMLVPKRTIRMYFNHITWGERLPIGVWTKIWKSKDGKLMGRGKIDLVDEFEEKIDKKIRLGTLDSISIGFIPLEYDGQTDTWTKAELSEASVVNEPANPSAVVTQKQLGFTEEEFEKSLKVKLKEGKHDDTEPFAGTPGTPPQAVVSDPATYNLSPPDQDEPVLTSDHSSDGSGAADTAELKAAIEDLSSRQGALEAAFKAANENPAKKNIERVRVALKKVDQSVEKANRVIKIKLSENK